MEPTASKGQGAGAARKSPVGIFSGVRGKTYEEKLKELNTTTLEERRLQLKMAQNFKIVGGFDEVNKTSGST